MFIKEPQRLRFNYSLFNRRLEFSFCLFYFSVCKNNFTEIAGVYKETLNVFFVGGRH